MLTSLFRISLRLFAKPFLGKPFPLGFQRVWAGLLTGIKSVAKGTSFDLIDMNGVPARLISIHNASDNVTLYLHGGAYVLGSPTSHRGLLSHMAVAANCRVYALDYRLAPEHVYPAALDDAIAAYKWLLDQGHDAKNIAIGGDSAGGGLAVAAINTLRDTGLPVPAKAVLISPFVDMTLSGDSMQSLAKADPMLRPDWLKDCGDLYRADTPASDPGCSPLLSDLKDFPPTIIHVGSEEILLDDSRRLKEKLESLGTAVEFRVFDKMWHDFQLEAGLIPAANESIAGIGAFLISQ